MARFTDDRIRAIITQVREPRVVEFPGQPEVKVAVRALADDEYDGCRVEAQRKIWDLSNQRGWDPVKVVDIDPTLMERFVEREVIVRAYFDAETVNQTNLIPFFSSTSELVSCGSVVISDLMKTYTEHQEWVNPTVTLSGDDVKELCQELGKGRAFGLSLAAIEHASLRRLLVSMAKLLSSSASGKSSTT